MLPLTGIQRKILTHLITTGVIIYGFQPLLASSADGDAQRILCAGPALTTVSRSQSHTRHSHPYDIRVPCVHLVGSG